MPISVILRGKLKMPVPNDEAIMANIAAAKDVLPI